MGTALEAIIDWLEFTIFETSIEAIFKCILLLNQDDFFRLPKGKMGYKGQLQNGGIVVLFNGSADMGVHVVLSGSGCRQYEHENFHNDFINHECQLPALIRRVKEYSHNFTRIDLAIDDFEGKIINFNRIEKEIHLQHYLTRWKGFSVVSNNQTKDNKSNGKTIYFGSRQSLIMMRIYEKGKEKQSNDKINWIRLELELKADRATNLIKTINLVNGIGFAVSAILTNYIKFIKPSADKNKSRWKIAIWWQKIVGNINKLKLTARPERKNVTHIKDWVKSQVSTSLAVISIDNPEEFEKFIVGITELGKAKLKEKHWKILGKERPEKRHY